MATKRGGGLCYHFGEKKFMPCFPSSMTKNFCLPFDGVGVSDGDWIFLVATKEGQPNFFSRPSLWWLKWDKVWWLQIFSHHFIITIFWMATEFFQSPQKRVVICFCKALVQRFSKTSGMPPFFGNWKNSITISKIVMVRW